MPVKSVIFNQSQLIFHHGLSSSASSMKIKVRMPQKTKPSFSDLGSLYVIYMIIIIKFHATEFPNTINLLRALRFTFEELFAFKRIFLTLSTLVAFGKFGPIDMKNRNKSCFVNNLMTYNIQKMTYRLQKMTYRLRKMTQI